MAPPPVLDWTAAAAAGAGVCGGKGWNLGRLAGWGFPVPDGGVLSAEVYRRVLAAPALRRLCAEFAAIGAAEAAGPAGPRLAYLRTAIEAAPLPEDADNALRHFLERTGLGRVPVAVRSSATAEDGGSTSFAGVHASVLDVTGADAVLRAVRRVYASLWTPQALAYRRRFLVPDDQVVCAIVVCRMVAARTAGVLFTCDPRDGRRDVIAISAAAGPGEAVVSGAVNPEEITVALRETGLAVERRSGPPVLDDAAALGLARLGLRATWALGDGQDPQDVEWARDGARAWLLQARPVTRVPRVAFPGSESLPVVWSTANIRDAVPFVATAMSWSLILPALRFMLWTWPAACGYPVPRGLEVARRFSGRAYFDVTSVQWVFYDAFGSLPAETNRATGGHHPAIPVPPGSPFRGWKGLARLRRLWRGARLLLRLPKIVPPRIDAVFAQARELRAVEPASLPNAGLLALLERLSLLQVEYGGPFMLSSSALAWQAELEKPLRKLSPGRGEAIAAALVAGGGAVVSAEQGTRLFDVADAARGDPAALEWLRREPFDAAAWRGLPADSGFRAEFARFLDEFGHRAVYEAEVATPRWNEEPGWLLEQVRHILDGQGRRPQAAARERREAAQREVATLTWLRRPQIRWLAARARQGAALRERAKSGLVVQVEPLRRLLLEVGRRLAATGHLAAPADVFHLTCIDVEMWLRGEWDGSGARTLVADRKDEMKRWEAERPPDAIVEGAAAAPRREAAAPTAGARTLRGLAVSSGRASGPARIVRHPSEGSRLRQGDVLVAPSTDPGWTPLFLRASAIVMEIGGMLSHGAIVAREYGLPAVVNIPGVLERVTDGQALIVDGDAGTVDLA
ncbi:MAG: hypothetical protein HYY18_06795 [Planctomycetes bacterium]|nr:hypothetical protein [Planctomycetota bacterium]